MGGFQCYGIDSSGDSASAAPAAPAALAMIVEMVAMGDMGRAASRAAARAALPVVNPFARMANSSKRPAVSPPEIQF